MERNHRNHLPDATPIDANMDDEAGGATVYLLHEEPSAPPQRTWLALPSTAAAALTAFCGLAFLALTANRLPASAIPASAMPTLAATGKPDGPPLLCYEFSARVRRRVILLGPSARESADASADEVTGDDTSEYVTHVSRKDDVVGILEENHQFEKEFASFSTADGDTCATIQTCGFFDELICDEFLASTPHHRNDGCSVRALMKQMPLDSSFSRPSPEYANAELVASWAAPRGGGASQQRWIYSPPVTLLNVSEDGLQYTAAIKARVTFDLDLDLDLSKGELPNKDEAGAGCGGRARLAFLRSELTTTLHCADDEEACAAAAMFRPRRLRTVTTTNFTALAPDDEVLKKLKPPDR